MSNYINVLRRLERERRMPEPIAVPLPTIPAAIPVAPAADVEPIAPTIAAPPAAPAPIVTMPAPVLADATVVATPAAPRTVIPLPTVQPVAPAVVEAPPRPVVSLPAPAPHHVDTRRARAFAPSEPHPGIETLLDNIRMLSSGRTSRMVVFCGASTAEAVTTLAAALAIHAEERGMRAFVGSLLRTATGAIVVPAQGAVDDAVSLRIDLDGTPAPEALHDWAQHLAPENDLVVLTGPPLASSIDAALLACHCDGLVIVAESEVTERVALHTAAERARIAGCRTLGVVMHGTKDHLPGWVRRFMGTPET